VFIIPHRTFPEKKVSDRSCKIKYTFCDIHSFENRAVYEVMEKTSQII